MRRLPFEYAVRNLGRSRLRMCLCILGSALVVSLVVAASAFVRGMDTALRQSGGADNILLLGAGSEESVERSEVASGIAGIIPASLKCVRSLAGVDYLSREVHMQLPVKTSVNQLKRPLVLVRGVTPAAMLVHNELQIAEGRFPMSGADEIMVGRMLATRIDAADGELAIGKTLHIDSRPWTIVGRFSAPGTVFDAEVWAALDDLKQATKRTTDSCLVITLDRRRGDFADVAAFSKMRVDLELAAVRETDYYDRLRDFFAPVRIVVWLTALLIAVGALLGGLNTMYAAFASRVRELATLQSLGFRRAAILLSLVQESALAVMTGGLIASTFAVLVLDGLAVRFSMGAFGLCVDSAVILIGLCAAMALGIIGALPPAWRCLRVSIPQALKSI